MTTLEEIEAIEKWCLKFKKQEEEKPQSEVSRYVGEKILENFAEKVRLLKEKV